MHGCLLGFILDPFTRLGALDLLRCSVWLCWAAKLRWCSLHLQINNNDHPGPRYNHGTILPCSHVALVVIYDPSIKNLKDHVILATQRQSLWFSSMKIMEDCREECKWLSARLTRETCPNDRRQPGVKSDCGWGEVGSILWGPRTPCGIWRCMMVMLYVRCRRLRRAKSFSRTCPLWKALGKKWSAATQIAVRYHDRDILSETVEPLRIGLDPHDSSSTTSYKTTHIVQVVCLSVIYT